MIILTKPQVNQLDATPSISGVESKGGPDHAAVSDRLMSVVARVSVPADQFVLGRTLELDPGVEIRLDPVIPIGDETVPYFWVDTDHADAVEETLRRSPVVEESRAVDEVDGETLFQVVWSSEVNGVVSAIETTGGVILEGRKNGNAWSFQLRFPDHAGLSEFYRICMDQRIPLDLQEVHSRAEIHQDTGSELTAEQREALRIAFGGGYFAVPRRMTLVELADELGISDTAASQRLRRGLYSVLSRSLDTEPTDEG